MKLLSIEHLRGEVPFLSETRPATANELQDYFSADEFDEWLDNCINPIETPWGDIDASVLLRNCDYSQYEVEFLEWRYNEAVNALERLETGELDELMLSGESVRGWPVCVTLEDDGEA